MTAIRVLVVDDDFRVADVHAQVAKGVQGCRVVGRATTLREAQAQLGVGVDLIIADEYLPDGSGSDLIGAADASVIMVTAANDQATLRRALVRGAVGYVVKPFPLPVLAERIADYVRFRQALDQAARPEQADIDHLTAMLRARQSPAQPPKGRSAVTAAAVVELLRATPEPLTAIAVAEAIGVSRATAQRYLSDLVDSHDVKLALRYGTAGRPEHSYVWAR